MFDLFDLFVCLFARLFIFICQAMYINRWSLLTDGLLRNPSFSHASDLFGENQTQFWANVRYKDLVHPLLESKHYQTLDVSFTTGNEELIQWRRQNSSQCHRVQTSGNQNWFIELHWKWVANWCVSFKIYQHTAFVIGMSCIFIFTLPSIFHDVK